MKERIKEIFNLKRIREYVEKNIDQVEWIEEDGGKQRTLVIDTLFDGRLGAYIPGWVLELFGQADEYDLENPHNLEKNEEIYDALTCLEDEVNECLNQLLPAKGTYYVGYNEADGSYCLFYTEYKEE